MKPRTLLRLYPAPWRERYGDEFVALLEREGTGPRVVLNVLAGAFDAWMSPKTPTEMALDGPFGPGILFGHENLDVNTREWLSFIGLSIGLGGLLSGIAGIFTDDPIWSYGLSFIMATHMVMPFLWLRYYSLRTRIAAAVWGPVVFLGFIAGGYWFFRLADWISRQ